MALFERMMTDCVRMEGKRTPDGSGGYTTEWTEGEHLKAAIVRDTSTEARIADAAGTVEKYTITVSRSVRLEYHAVIKRLSDGKTFRITSDNADHHTPTCTDLDMSQASADAWRLTT